MAAGERERSRERRSRSQSQARANSQQRAPLSWSREGSRVLSQREARLEKQFNELKIEQINISSLDRVANYVFEIILCQRAWVRSKEK